MKSINIDKFVNKQMPTRSTHTVDCFRKIRGDDGVVEVKRWQDERNVTVNLTIANGGVFHRGARIA